MQLDPKTVLETEVARLRKEVDETEESLEVAKRDALIALLDGLAEHTSPDLMMQATSIRAEAQKLGQTQKRLDSLTTLLRQIDQGALRPELAAMLQRVEKAAQA